MVAPAGLGINKVDNSKGKVCVFVSLTRSELVVANFPAFEACLINNRFTCLAKFKPVKQEVSLACSHTSTYKVSECFSD